MTVSIPAADDLDAAASAARLEALIAARGRCIVAFSGGVDSSVVAVAATRALGEEALCVTADTESNTTEDLAICRDIATRFALRHEVVRYSELAIEGYAANTPNRCYFCKSELYTRLTALAASRAIPTILDGSNLDDAGDYRPGLKAVAEHRVASPLREAGLRKGDVRAVALHYGLPNHDRPASPCLSSRIPYGQPVTRQKLDQVAEAERLLRAMGLTQFRCRHHGDVARLEVEPTDFGIVITRRKEILDGLRALGFHFVALDLAGFRSGNLNRVLSQPVVETN